VADTITDNTLVVTVLADGGYTITRNGVPDTKYAGYSEITVSSTDWCLTCANPDGVTFTAGPITLNLTAVIDAIRLAFGLYPYEELVFDRVVVGVHAGGNDLTVDGVPIPLTIAQMNAAACTTPVERRQLHRLGKMLVTIGDIADTVKEANDTAYKALLAAENAESMAEGAETTAAAAEERAEEAYSLADGALGKADEADEKAADVESDLEDVKERLDAVCQRVTNLEETELCELRDWMSGLEAARTTLTGENTALSARVNDLETRLKAFVADKEVEDKKNTLADYYYAGALNLVAVPSAIVAESDKFTYKPFGAEEAAPITTSTAPAPFTKEIVRTEADYAAAMTGRYPQVIVVSREQYKTLCGWGVLHITDHAYIDVHRTFGSVWVGRFNTVAYLEVVVDDLKAPAPTGWAFKD
jgi:hypothetical protein